MDRRRLLGADASTQSINAPVKAADPAAEAAGVSVRFWLGFASIMFLMLQQGFQGGFTSPVLSTNCGDVEHGMAGSTSGSDSAAGTDLPCPECLNCELGLSLELQSTFVALPSLVAIPTSLLGGGFVDKLGRRRSLILANLGVVIGWAMVCAAPVPDPAQRAKLQASQLWPGLTTPTALMLVGGRVITSVCMNIQVIAATVWLGECCPSSVRGAIMTSTSYGWCGGTLVIYALGTVLEWRTLGMTAGGLALATLVLSSSLVESPRWLATHRGMPEAERALRQLRPAHAELRGTLADIARFASDSKHAAAGGEGGAGARDTAASSGPGPARLQPILLASVIMASVPLSGVLVVALFAGELLDKVFPAHRNAAAVVLPVAAGVGVTLAAAGIDRLGRRPMLMFSCVGMMLCMATMAGFYWCEERGEWVGLSQPAWEWAAFASLALYMMFNQAGLGPLATVLATELPAPSVRGLALGVAVATAGITQTATNYATLPVGNTIGYKWMFGFYAAANAAIALFVLLCVPETKGRTLEQIQDRQEEPLRSARTRAA